MVDSMKLTYGLQGKEKKRLVSAVAEYEGVAPTYLATPTFAYRIGRFLVDREGNVNGTEEPLEALEESLKEAGFVRLSPPEEATEQTEGAETEEAEGKAAELRPGGELLRRGILLDDVPVVVVDSMLVKPLLGLLAGGALGILEKEDACHVCSCPSGGASRG